MTETKNNFFYPTTGHTTSDYIKLQMLKDKLRLLKNKFNIFVVNEKLKQLEQKNIFINNEINVYHPYNIEEMEQKEREYNNKINKILRRKNKADETMEMIKEEINKIEAKYDGQISDDESQITDSEDEEEEENENEGKNKPLYYNKNNNLYINVYNENN